MKKKLLIVMLLGLVSISLTGCLSMLFPELNNPPDITSVPVLTAYVGMEYVYDIVASDPDEDILTYSLNDSPDEMAVGLNTGVISWIPTAVGSFEVTVEVSDGKLNDIQSFSIEVSEPPNQAPVITSTPVTSIILGDTYIYSLQVSDFEGDDIVYTLTTKPVGMTISNTGEISWNPTNVGDFEVTVEVSDGELTDTQSFIITVTSFNQAPVINPIPNDSIIAGEAYTYNIQATDPEGDNLAYTLTTKPVGMMISNEGVINWIPNTLGIIEVIVEVSDGELNDTQSFIIEVTVPDRVVMLELFEGPACSRCAAIHSDIVKLRQEYGLDELVILEEYGWDAYSLGYTGWGINDVVDRYYEYIHYLNIDGHFPDAYFNGINQTVHFDDSGYKNYKNAIEVEIAKPAQISLSASYDTQGKIISITGNVINFTSGSLNNLVIEAMVYEDSVYSEYRNYNVDHVVRDIITSEESGEQIASFSPGENHQFSLTSSYLSKAQNMSNVHIVVYVQAPNSSTKEILQALYLD